MLHSSSLLSHESSLDASLPRAWYSHSLVLLTCLVILACQFTGAQVARPLASSPIAATSVATSDGLAIPDTQPQHPFPQHVGYAPGTLRPDHLTQAQQDNDVRAFYEHWKASYLVSAGTNAIGQMLYRVSFGSTDPGRTVSEGQGYGMIITAIMAGYDPQAQTYFDGLWRFARSYPSDIDSRLMGWQVPPDPQGNDSAFDGDADMAYALLLANAQWGSAGEIDYAAAAGELITAIYQSTIGTQSHLPMLGDWVDSYGADYSQYTPRSSDFMLAHFRAYGRATGDYVWLQVVNACQTSIASLQSNFGPATGLLPDFITPVSSSNLSPRPAPPGFLEGPHDGDYYYNALRDPWRIATDALLNNDPVSMSQARKLSTWAEAATGGDPTQFKAGYYLDGRSLPGSHYFTTAFVAPLGPAAMTLPTQQDWLNAIYDSVSHTYFDYYEDSLTLLSLILMTGNYWDPTTPIIGSARIYLPLVAH